MVMTGAVFVQRGAGVPAAGAGRGGQAGPPAGRGRGAAGRHRGHGRHGAGQVRALMNNINNNDDPLTQDLHLQQRGEREVPEVGDQCGLLQVTVPGPRPRQWRDHCQWRAHGQWRGQWSQWADHC